MRKAIPLLATLSLILASFACSLPSVPVGSGTSTPHADSDTPEAGTPAPMPTLVETPSSLDPCLIGVWTMDVYALNNKMLDLTGSPSMTVIAPSQMTIEFRADNTYIINGMVTVHFDLSNTGDYLEMDGTSAGQGYFTADGTTLLVTSSDYQIAYSEMRSVINGQSQSGGFGNIPMPDNALAPAPSAGYVCSGNSLQITYTVSTGTVTEEWNR